MESKGLMNLLITEEDPSLNIVNPGSNLPKTIAYFPKTEIFYIFYSLLGISVLFFPEKSS